MRFQIFPADEMSTDEKPTNARRGDDRAGPFRSPFPYAVLPCATALDDLVGLRISYPDVHPVLLGDMTEAATLVAGCDARDPRKVLEALAAGRAANWLDHALDTVAASDTDGPPIEADGPLPAPHVSPLVLIDHRTGVLKPNLIAGLIPAANHTDVHAYLGFGGFGRCPPSEVHVALARQWHDRFAARIIATTADVVEFEVARPPISRDDALELAWVQYRYCPDLVDQLVGSIEGLAATLRGARYWHFWWERP